MPEILKDKSPWRSDFFKVRMTLLEKRSAWLTVRAILVLGLVFYAPLSALAKDNYFYLVPKPIVTDVHMTKLSVGMHAVQVTSFEFAKIWLYVETLGPWGAAATYAAVEIPTWPNVFVTRPILELEIRALGKRLTLQNVLSKIPDLKNVHILTSRIRNWWGPVVASQKLMRFVMFETSKPLPDFPDLVENESWDKIWGEPIEIPDRHQSHLVLTLKGVTRKTKTWTLPLPDLLVGAVLPDDILEDWRQSIYDEKEIKEEGKQFFSRLKTRFSPNRNRDFVIEGVLHLPDGSQIDIGNILEGNSVARLVGTTWTTGLSRSTRRTLSLSPPPKNGIPITTVPVVTTDSATCRDRLLRLIGRKIIVY